jgi:hypothetical protein
MSYVPLPPGIPINTVTMAGGTTASMNTIAAGMYKRIYIRSRTTGGMVVGAPVTLRINGDSGANYDSISLYSGGVNANPASTSAQIALTASAATVRDLKLRIAIEPLVVTGTARPIEVAFWSRGSVDATLITGTSNGFYLNTSSGITDVQLIFGNAATGTVEFSGEPA